MSRRSIFVLLFVAIAACGRNPYQQLSVQKDKPVFVFTGQDFRVSAPRSITCIEGLPCSAKMLGSVPPPGRATLEMTGLPAGASFDPETGILTFSPDFDAVDIASHPDQPEVQQVLTVNVRSTALAQDVVLSHPVLLTIRNVMRPISGLLATQITGVQLNPLSQTIRIDSPDFPSGPYQVVLIGAPPEAVLEPVEGSPNLFVARFTPPMGFVRLYDPYDGFKRVRYTPVQYRVTLPDGSTKDFQSVWVVQES